MADLEISGENCSICGLELTDTACWDEDGYCCEKCISRQLAATEPEAEEYARAKCRITATFPEYDSDDEYRCTPDEYDAGSCELYSPNSFHCHCRHNCTNYDELINGLDRDDVVDQVFYSAIRDRIDKLVSDEIARVSQ